MLFILNNILRVKLNNFLLPVKEKNEDLLQEISSVKNRIHFSEEISRNKSRSCKDCGRGDWIFLYLCTLHFVGTIAAQLDILFFIKLTFLTDETLS